MGVRGSAGNLPVLFGSIFEKKVRRQAADASRLAACASQKQIKHEDEASAGDEWAESIPRFAPFGFALPKFRFEVS